MDPLKWKQLVCRIDALMPEVESYNPDFGLSDDEKGFVQEIWSLIRNKPSEEFSAQFVKECVAQLKEKFKKICIDESNAQIVYKKVVRHFNGSLGYTGPAVEYFFDDLWRKLLVATTWEDSSELKSQL